MKQKNYTIENLYNGITYEMKKRSTWKKEIKYLLYGLNYGKKVVRKIVVNSTKVVLAPLEYYKLCKKQYKTKVAR
jgi:hypothetical protein